MRASSAIIALVAAAVLTQGGPAHAQVPAPAGTAASRVLVAPVRARGDVANAPIAAALPALIAEAIEADNRYMASLAHDLSPVTLQQLGISQGALPTAETLSSGAAAKTLKKSASVRVLVLPALEKKGASFALSLEWRDLAGEKKGTVPEKASSAAGLIDAAGRGAAAARAAWQASWQGPRAGATEAPAPLHRITSSSVDAVTAWAAAGDAWCRGDVPGAEKSLAAALAADKSFDRARLDLAWIRLGQGRAEESKSLADAALAGGKLSPSASALASVVSAAGSRNSEALQKLADQFQESAPASPLGLLARGLADNMTGAHERAVSELDPMRLQRPNDPALVYQAGLAALGVGDQYESLPDLQRAHDLWPQHDRITMDLAEAKARTHDLAAAGRILDEWTQKFDPNSPPTWGGKWSVEDPPPPVRDVCVDAIQGAISPAIDKLEKTAAALSISGGPVAVRVPVLYYLHELQMQAAFGTDLERQHWLNAARSSLKELRSLVPPEEQKAKPWLLDRLTAELRIREDRLDEAEKLREKIMAASALPGYDPGIEAEVETDIALKKGDTKEFFAAANRAVKVRDSIMDRGQLAEGYLIARLFDKAEQNYKILEQRLDFWNAARRRDALLWDPDTSAAVPFIYYVGAETSVHRNKLELMHERFGIFLAYFRRSDPKFNRFVRDGFDRGAKPSW